MNTSYNATDEEIQAILNKVIDGGFYQYYHLEYSYSCYMCRALRYALMEEIITEMEHWEAHKAIQEYIKPLMLLEPMLRTNNLPSDFEARLFLYKNWDSRPKLLSP